MVYKLSPFLFGLFVEYSRMANDTGAIRCPILLDSNKSMFDLRHKRKFTPHINISGNNILIICYELL